MPRFQSSIVIPVFNKWDLTRICLKSVAATTDREKVEVIVVDNASSDVTPQACPALGQKLFGDSFRYIRNDQNRNFAGASNQGASAAAGEYLVFLNNDTEALPGWYEPLIDDFSRFANIAATGPVLLYPRDKIFGHTVQHLGVLVTPFFALGHLYRGIPAGSPLAKKRRFFQIITAACMVMPRSIFMNAGMFDEAFINGFEDVDLCARLSHKGYRMTINPKSRLIHHESQSEGRNDHDEANSNLLREKSLRLLRQDWHLLLKDDDLRLRLTDRLYLISALPPAIEERLDQALKNNTMQQLREMLTATPLWKKGWLNFARQLKEPNLRLSMLDKGHQIFRDPEFMLRAFQEYRKKGDRQGMRKAMARLDFFASPADEYLDCAKFLSQLFKNHNQPELARQYDTWLGKYTQFVKKQAQLKKHCDELKKYMENN